MEVHFIILLALLFANLLPIKKRLKKKYILSISFMILFVYWALRYEYGQDYWAYYDYFYSGRESEKGFGELLFYKVFFPLFKYYYQAVIVQSAYVLFTLYYMVKRYVPTKCYWLFFLLFLCVPGFHFSLISAMRSSMAAATMFWAYHLFYINKNNIILYEVMVIVATLFHTSSIVFVILPFVDLVFMKMKGNLIFIMLFVFLVLSMTIGNKLFIFATDNDTMLGSYGHLSEGFGNSNLLGALHKGIILIPSFFICKYYNIINDNHIKRIFVLAFLCLSIRLLNLDFNGRFTAYLFFFFICAFSYTLLIAPKVRKFIMCIPFFFVVAFDLYIFYANIMVNASNYINGNFLVYRTIFEAPSLP